MMMDILNFKTTKEICMEIAKNARVKRKGMKLTQEEFSKKAGISLGSLKRFERTGMISLESLVKIAFACDCTAELEQLFSRREYKSIQEVIDENN